MVLVSLSNNEIILVFLVAFFYLMQNDSRREHLADLLFI